MHALVQPPAPFTQPRILVRGQGHPWWAGLSVKAIETVHRRHVQQPIFLPILYSVSRQLTLLSQGLSKGFLPFKKLYLPAGQGWQFHLVG